MFEDLLLIIHVMHKALQGREITLGDASNLTEKFSVILLNRYVLKVGFPCVVAQKNSLLKMTYQRFSRQVTAPLAAQQGTSKLH